MKFNVDGKLFQQQLTAVSKVISSKNTLAILNNFLLTVEDDQLTITGCDQENVLTATMPVTDSDGDVSVAVPARRLLEITKEIANQPLTINVNEDTKEIDLRFMNGHFNFMGVNADEYPRMRDEKTDRIGIILPASVILKGLENTYFAVSTDTVRPIMTGIYWDIHESDITFVSSDTHKLVRYTNREKAPGVVASFILPAKVANIIRGLLTQSDADVAISFDEKGGTFEFGDFMLSCLFIRGRYPDYNRVIPQSNPYTLTVDRETLQSAIRRVNLFAAKDSRLIVLNIDETQLILNAQDYDYSTSAEERVACNYEGSKLTIGFNGAYMAEILANLKCDEVVMKFSQPARPGLYTPAEQKEGEDIVIVQMPVQVI